MLKLYRKIEINIELWIPMIWEGPMKTRIKTGKVSLIVFIALMAVCVAGVAIWCYAVGHQVKEHRQGGPVTWVEYNR